MSENSDASEERTGGEKTTTRDEVRTIAFRLREIQRLLSTRVAQENRRLEADGLDPVTEESVFTQAENQSEDSGT
jgi:hypothetical protein